MPSELTDEMLRQIMPNAPKARRRESLPILTAAMQAYEINNERRVAAWLATLAIESGELKYQQEIASGEAYEGRKDLGNTQPGDGRRFKGHGRIQITGRANHAAYTNYLRDKGHLPFVDLIKEPQRLAEEPYATDSAAWFWAIYKNLNPLADKRQFLKTQIAVNGRNKKTGLPNHWNERKAYYERALQVLPDDFLFDGADAIDDDSETDIDEALEPKETSVETVASQPPVVEVRPPNTSITTKIAAAASAASPVIAATGMKIGGVEFKTGGLIAFAAVVIVGMVIAAWLWNASQQRRHEELKLGMQNLASPDKGNVIAAGSKV